MGVYKQHQNLANERFLAAEEQFKEEKFQTAAHLFINAVINYHNALCQKYLNKIPSHKQHSDTSYFKELAKFIGKDSKEYRANFEFLMTCKSQADYGVGLPTTQANQIRRRACKIKEIIEQLL